LKFHYNRNDSTNSEAKIMVDLLYGEAETKGQTLGINLGITQIQINSSLKILELASEYNQFYYKICSEFYKKEIEESKRSL